MTDSSSNLFIDTPENLTLEAEIAGFGGRALAALIDYIAIFAVLLGLFMAFSSSLFPADSDTGGTALVLFVIVPFVLITFYHLGFELAWNGQTPGKRRVGIRVVGANGRPVTPTAVFIRNTVRVFDFLPLFYGLGLIVLFASKRTQRLGDLAAGTLVVYDRKPLTVEALREDLNVRYALIRRTSPIPPEIDISALTSEDRRVIVDYLQRRGQFTNRRQIADALAARYQQKMHPDRPISAMSSDVLLEWIARAFELRALDETPQNPE